MMARMAMQHTAHSEAERPVQILTALREANISGRKLARDLGKTAPYISRRLTGEVEFSATDLTQIADYLGTSVDKLLGRAS